MVSTEQPLLQGSYTNRFYSRLILFLTLYILALTTACTRPQSQTEVIIGEFVSKNGAEAQFGKSVANGVALAVEEINSQGGIIFGGADKQDSSEDNKGQKSIKKKVRVISIETDGEKAKIEKAIEEFADNPDVFAVIGEVSSEKSNWAAKVAQAEKLPMISPASTNPNVTDNGPFIFRACYIDPFQGSAMAMFAFNDLKIKKVIILRHDKSNYSLGLSEYFSEKFIKLGGRILSEETYSTAQGLPDLKKQIEVIKRLQPEAIFMPVYYSEAAYLAKKIRGAGVRSVFLGGDGWDSPQLFELDSKSVEGVYFSNHFSAEKDDEVVQKFVKRYKKSFGEVPDGTAAMGYDAARIALAAIQRVAASGSGSGSKFGLPRGNISRDDVRKEIAATTGFIGVSGTITIDENRNAQKSIVVLKSAAGQFRYVKTIQPD